MSKTATSRAAGSLRARTRLAAVVLLGLLAAGYAVLGVTFAVVELQVVFTSSLAAVIGSALVFAVLLAALVYALSARWVAKQVRWGHLIAMGATLIGAVLNLSAAMGWQQWLSLLANLLALACLSACIPRRR